MPKPKTVTKQQRKAIRSYVKKGITANKIQKRLRARHMGMRRTVLLSQIRKVKHQKPKANRLKHTPKKYQRMTSGVPHPSRERRQTMSGRQVAVYGYARTRRNPRPYSARFEFYGSGKDLFKAVKLAHDGFVPRKEWAFVKCSAREFLSNPEVYGERGEWSDSPRVES
jgi:hypothetical protein